MKNWCARHVRGAWLLWCGLGLALTLAVELSFLFRTGGMPTGLLILGFVVWAMAGWFLVNIGAVKRSQAPIRALNENCDPELLLRWGDDELAYWQGRRVNYRYIAVCLMNRGVALSALGRYDEMYGMYMAVDERQMARQAARIRAVYEYNRCVCFLGLGRLEEAGTALRTAEELAAKLKNANAMEVSFRMAHCELDLMNGRTEGVEAELSEALENAGHAYQRVYVHFLLARLYQAQGREDEARVHLRYVVEHGNKLYIRQAAEEALKTPLKESL